MSVCAVCVGACACVTYTYIFKGRAIRLMFIDLCFLMTVVLCISNMMWHFSTYDEWLDQGNWHISIALVTFSYWEWSESFLLVCFLILYTKNDDVDQNQLEEKDLFVYTF